MQPFSESELLPIDSGLRRSARRKRSAGPQDPAESPNFITALARGLEVMRCFKPGSGPLGNLELAALTGLPKPTISRITYTLKSLGYLRYHDDTGRYSPGYSVLALGFGSLAGMEMRALAQPIMQRLATETQAAVALGVYDQGAMTYIEAIHGSPALYLRLPVGHRVGMHSAMGRAYLACLTEADRAITLGELTADVPSASLIGTACRDYLDAGCCFAFGDWQAGINAVAVPFEAPNGDGRMVMSCGGPATTLRAERMRGPVAQSLLHAVRQLSGVG